MIETPPLPLVDREAWQRATLAARLSEAEKVVAAIMATNADVTGEHTAISVDTINKTYAMSPSRIQTAIKNLRAAGWLVLVEAGGPRRGGPVLPNRYRLTYPNVIDKGRDRRD